MSPKWLVRLCCEHGKSDELHGLLAVFSLLPYRAPAMRVGLIRELSL